MRLILTVLLLLVAGCGDTTTEPAVQRTLTLVTGGDQSSGLGGTLTQPIQIRVLDDGQPARDVEVRWLVIEGGGSVDERVMQTDAAGLATVVWTLGLERGQQLLLATSGDATLTVRATAQFLLASVAVGFRHVCALSAIGQAYCWGSNGSGQLGDGTEIDRAVPTRVESAVLFKSLTAGWSHTCGIAVDGEAHCWGDNTVGQLGIGSTARRVHVPTPVVESSGFIDLSAGFVHTCGVTEDGTARCWGSNGFGQLGGDRLAQVRTVTAGEFHTCAVRTDNSAWCWGSNSDGQIGANAPFGAIIAVPTPTSGGILFQNVATRVRHNCGVATDARVYCWGRNAVGETGQDPFVAAPLPTRVIGADNFSWVGTGNVHTCGLSAGRAYCWGALLGNGTTATSKTPVAVGSTLQFTSMSVGYDRTCAVANGEVWCWGAGTLSPARVVFP